MTAPAEHFTKPEDDHGIQRRRRIIVAAAVALVVLVGGVATLATLRHLDHQYGPLQGGPFNGLYSDHGLVFSKDGSSYHLADAPGATAQMIASIGNLGAHSVKITSIETGDMVGSIRWSAYRVVAGGSVEGVATPWSGFPAVVPAHGTIRLLITIHHPNNCNAYPKYHGVSEGAYSGNHIVHWDSILHRHATQVDVLVGRDEGIRVC
jgi:hypothetical protein